MLDVNPPHSYDPTKDGLPESTWIAPSPWTRAADTLVILMAIALPWTTSAFSILTVLWILVLARVSKADQLWEILKSPQCSLPAALFLLCIVGMLWSDEEWTTKLHAASAFAKLLALPLLVYQFRQSNNGTLVFLAFLASCTVLLLLSWLNWFDHRTILFSARVIGVPVKNWITQGVEFVLCIFGAVALCIAAWRAKRYRAGSGFALLSLLFLLNVIFVVSSRTALVSLPLLFFIATFKYLGRRELLIVYGVAVLAATAAWFIAPNLRNRLESLQQQFTQYENTGELTSVGLRIEYWTKSLEFIQEAPLIGHGTGSIRSLFERDAAQKITARSEIVANPHNQILYCTIQWGIVGAFMLLAMWLYHLTTFSAYGWLSWVGRIIVVQNIFSSLFNSHIADFVEGWIYVLGVGIATGMMFKSRDQIGRTTGQT